MVGCRYGRKDMSMESKEKMLQEITVNEKNGSFDDEYCQLGYNFRRGVGTNLIFKEGLQRTNVEKMNIL